jgi:SsrA-binding protein
MAGKSEARQGGAGRPAGARKTIAHNRKAKFKFEVLETFEAGLVLTGTEVKTLRAGLASIEESYGRIQDGELFLIGARIEEYTHGNRANHEPNRRRKLLLKKREVARLHEKVAQKGFTIVPLELFFNERGWAKVKIALCRGKKVHDKRDAIRTKEARKEIRRVL